MRILIDESLPIALARDLGIAVVPVTGVRNRMQDLRPLLPLITNAVRTIQKGQLIELTG